MKPFFFLLTQLSLVTIVFIFAYRAGYRAAQSKAMSVVKKFADPATSLLDQLNESIKEAKEDEHPTSKTEKTEHRTPNAEHRIMMSLRSSFNFFDCSVMFQSLEFLVAS